MSFQVHGFDLCVCLEGPVLLRHMSCNHIVSGLTTG